MTEPSEIDRLKAQIDELAVDNARLRTEGFRGSRAEALMALE